MQAKVTMDGARKSENIVTYKWNGIGGIDPGWWLLEVGVSGSSKSYKVVKIHKKEEIVKICKNIQSKKDNLY